MKTSITMLVLIAAAAVGAPAMATVSASARPSEETHTVRVHYADLNLSTDQGAHELFRRIAFAAHEACADVISPSYVLLDRNYQQCRQTAMEHAVATVDQQKLTALYDKRFPENPVASNKTAHGSHAVG